MLEVRDLACARGDQSLFAGLGFGVGPGEVLWVEGPNGAGKTTLLRILAGLATPDSGEVLWRGEGGRAGREARAREGLWVGHLDALKDDLSVAENLRFHAALAELDQAPDQVDAALAAVGLDDRSHLPVRVLSRGQRRRTALARLRLAARRPLWILDEPFAALDSASVEGLAATVAGHARAGGLVVLTTHQPVDFPGVPARRLGLGAAS